jgi:hypothetical protein
VADDGGAGECVTPLKTGCCAKGCRDASALLPVAVSPHEILLDWKWDGDHGNVPGTPPAPPPPLRTKWTRRVPHPVLIGRAASLIPPSSPTLASTLAAGFEVC